MYRLDSPYRTTLETALLHITADNYFIIYNTLKPNNVHSDINDNS